MNYTAYLLGLISLTSILLTYTTDAYNFRTKPLNNFNNQQIKQNNDNKRSLSIYQSDKTNDNLLNIDINAKSLSQSIPLTTEEIADYHKDIRRTLLWVLATAGFAGIIASTRGVTSAIEFASGYVLEQSLSIDNLFVFLVLFDFFAVPKESQDRVLSYGLWGAIILRGLFIGLGFVALQEFHQILLVFAVILLFSSYKILFGKEDDDEDISENGVIKFAKKYLKSTDKFDGQKFFTIENGVKVATPLFLCLISVELSDVIFALDSVPAVFGVTKDPFIVFTSNIFAIASLRSVYGVLSKAVAQLEYLEKAVGVVLGIISIKMAAETFNIELLTPFQSLVVVLSVLLTGVLASLAKQRSVASTSTSEVLK